MTCWIMSAILRAVRCSDALPKAGRSLGQEADREVALVCDRIGRGFDMGDTLSLGCERTQEIFFHFGFVVNRRRNYRGCAVFLS